ncbi:MAG: DUF58 domain-containing protein [Sedimentisphaerales bacterium]|nr:DUF58 domain-containing protein [Sedimentisphaerales bacterium]
MRKREQTINRSEGLLSFGLTDAGKVALNGIVFVALTAMAFPAFGILSILVWVVLFALAAGFILRPRIKLNGTLPDRIMAGQNTVLRYKVKNVGRFPVYNLWVTFNALPEGIEQTGDEQIISRLGPDESIEVTLSIKSTRRGHYHIKQPVCQSSFPFNLFRFGTFHPVEENLIVLPAFYAIQVPTHGIYRQVQTGSSRPVGRMGHSNEYAGNRPFLPGDSPRQIDVRAWARLAVPATREYHDDFDYAAALVVDHLVPDTLHKESKGQQQQQTTENKELEAAVSLCASIAFSMNRDRLIDLLLIGSDLHRFTDCPRTLRLDRIHETLAVVEPTRREPTELNEKKWIRQFREISEVVFILMNWTPTYRHMIELAYQAGCHTTVLMIGEPQNIQSNQDSENWDEKIRFVSADEILSGHIEHI